MTLKDAEETARQIKANDGECEGVDCSKCFRRSICRGEDFFEHDYRDINLRAADRYIESLAAMGVN